MAILHGLFILRYLSKKIALSKSGQNLSVAFEILSFLCIFSVFSNGKWRS